MKRATLGATLLTLGLAAMADSDDGVVNKGATGSGARTLARFATAF